MPANELKPCPFCAAGETCIVPNQNWTGMRYAIHSYTLRHICADRTVITMTRNTEALLIAAWNRRPREDRIQRRMERIDSMLTESVEALKAAEAEIQLLKDK
ncbi:hypothetical protein [Serratia sp. Nf2]|uniref:hypothetical protein n=1 Tax=Serratia sp. Nf2 TaxID=2116540 RepID=UPI000D177625|nr:hypothetical protein [Serratia sp. Nf2]PTA75368.1 hypothetical protein C9411_19950 [Serratia sp. Nf2]